MRACLLVRPKCWASWSIKSIWMTGFDDRDDRFWDLLSILSWVYLDGRMDTYCSYNMLKQFKTHSHIICVQPRTQNFRYFMRGSCWDPGEGLAWHHLQTWTLNIAKFIMSRNLWKKTAHMSIPIGQVRGSTPSTFVGRWLDRPVYFKLSSTYSDPVKKTELNITMIQKHDAAPLSDDFWRHFSPAGE